MCLKPRRAKFQRSNTWKTFLKLRFNGEKVRNSIENWPYLENGDRYGQGYY